MEVPAGWHNLYVNTTLETEQVIEALEWILGKDNFYLKVQFYLDTMITFFANSC